MNKEFLDYTKEKEFELPSHKALLKTLGEHDTMAEFVYLALEHFEQQLLNENQEAIKLICQLANK